MAATRQMPHTYLILCQCVDVKDSEMAVFTAAVIVMVRNPSYECTADDGCVCAVWGIDL